MTRPLKIIKGITYSAITLSVTLLALALIVSRWGYGGYRAYVVLSGSMEPSVKKASIVLVVPQKTYAVGDIITLAESDNPDTTLTHRIRDITTQDGKTQYVTKGDANEDPDPEKRLPEKIIGKVVFSIPYLGYLVTFTRTTLGLILLIVIPATIIIYSELVTIKNEIQKMMTKKIMKLSSRT
ncbi:MAG: signal peptidase I [Candidatus Roizmanbacteria bacterium]|nr:signal peptidase I [Candidatus Roizmanbacteria bacterium]